MSVTPKTDFAPFVHPEKPKEGEPYGLLWVDLETTGLEPEGGHILEIALLETDFAYPFVPRGEVMHVVLQPGEGWNPFMLDEKVFDMHSRSGLLSEVKKSSYSPHHIDRVLNQASNGWHYSISAENKNRLLLAGATVSFDKRWLAAKAGGNSSFWRHLSHQVFDASCIMNYCLSRGMPKPERSESNHRAREDLLRSIDLVRTCSDWLDGRKIGVGL